MPTETNPSDESIAVRVQKGEQAAFGIFIERYEAKMVRYARKFLFHGDDVADLVQEIFIKAYVNIKSFDPGRRFSPWLYRLAHNVFVNALRARARDRANFSLFDVDVLFPHPIAKETSDDAAMRNEVKAALDASLGSIDAKYREPLVLYYFEDLDYRSIAEILRIPRGTVAIRIRRGKALLKKMIVP